MSSALVSQPRLAIPMPSSVSAAIRPATKVPWPLLSPGEAHNGRSSAQTSGPTMTLPTSCAWETSTPVSSTATKTLGLPRVMPQAWEALTAHKSDWPSGCTTVAPGPAEGFSTFTGVVGPHDAE